MYMSEIGMLSDVFAFISPRSLIDEKIKLIPEITEIYLKNEPLYFL